MKLKILLSMLAVAALPAAALADEAAVLKKQVEANHIKSMKAFEKKDIKTIMSFVSPKYKAIGMDGQPVNKAGLQKEMEGHMRDTKKVHSSDYKVTNVKVSGNKASGKANFKLDATVVDNDGMMGTKGATHRMKMDMLYNATWEKSGGKWLLTAETAAGPPTMLIDGKPMGGPPTPAPTGKASSRK